MTTMVQNRQQIGMLPMFIDYIKYFEPMPPYKLTKDIVIEAYTSQKRFEATVFLKTPSLGFENL